VAFLYKELVALLLTNHKQTFNTDRHALRFGVSCLLSAVCRVSCNSTKQQFMVTDIPWYSS